MSRKLLVALLLITFLLPLGAFAVTAQDSSIDVPMFQGNPARTGEMPGPGPDPDREIGALWSFQPQDGQPFFHPPA